MQGYSGEIWQPDYVSEFKRREKLLGDILRNPELAIGINEWYRTHPVDLFNDWFVTIDPRNAFDPNLPTFIPFNLWKRQEELVHWFIDRLNNNESGLVEKSRDAGVTWIFCGLSVWLWLYYEDTALGWGSRKADLVDRNGDPKSIFEKIRTILQYLPSFLLPEAYKPKKHNTFMKIINPNNYSTVTGEAGLNIGRGGRTLVYFKDESAHYEHAESIEAALSENTNIQIDFSSVNGTGNVFYRKRNSGIPIFIMDWSEDPRKSKEWYKAKKAQYDSMGIGFIFSQEIDRDYTSAIDKIVIQGKWVKACIDAHKKLGFEPTGRVEAGLDVADEGGDKNALTIRKGVVVTFVSRWGEGDTSKTAVKAWNYCRKEKVELFKYDSIGVGAGVKGKTNELVKYEKSKSDKNKQYLPRVEGWAAGGSVYDPWEDFAPDKTNEDMFDNIKAQEWWELRIRCEKTYKMVMGEETYPIDELISIDSSCPHLDEIEAQLSQPTYDLTGVGKVTIDKKADGAESPNIADSIVICFARVHEGDKAYL